MPASGIGSGKIEGAVITVTNGTVSETDAEGYALNIAVLENGNITISNDEGKYLGYASSTNFNATEGYEWIPTAREDGTVMYVASTGATRAITYRTGTTNKFAPYAFSNIGSNAEYNNVALLPILKAGDCNHENAESVVTTPATCTVAGESTWTCSCGATGTTVIPATGHNVVEWTETVAPGCTTKGEKSGTCTNEGCGETVTEVIYATGHTYGEATVVAPTCTEGGYTSTPCTVCDYVKKSDETPATGHNFENGKCTVCEEPQGESTYYDQVAPEAVVAGNYIIVSNRNSTADPLPMYPATSGISSGHWNVSDVAVDVENGTIDSVNLPANAVVFTLTGDNTNGFTISYTDAEGVAMYLGYSSYAKAKNAFAAEYSNFLWKVVVNDKGNVGLQTADADGNLYTISSNSTATTALRGYANGTVYNSVLFFKERGEDEEPPCTHTNTEEIVAVDATCTTAGNTAGVKCADCGLVLSGNEYVEATGHANSTSFVDGTVTITCSVCGNVETATLNTLAEAKAYTDKNVVYNVKGIVTYISGRTVYIQDGNDALCVYFHYDVDTTALNLGDEIFVSSTMTTYSGLIETNSPKEYVLVSTGNELPNNTTLAVADLMADTTNEYLGERVTFTGMTVTAIDAKSTVSLTAADGTAIQIYAAKGIEEIVAVDDVINVTAIVSIYKTTYQLIVNPATMAEDVVIAPAVPVEPELVNIKIGHTLNLASDISINFAVAASLLTNYTEYYMECTIPVYTENTQTGTRVVTIEPVVNGSYYYFTLTGITAINMNDMVEARLYMTDGTQNYVSQVDEYSVCKYAYSQMDKANNPVSLKLLCADLLRYGAAAQTLKLYRVDALADASMTDAHKAYLSDIENITFGNNKADLGDFENKGVQWVGRGLDLNSKVIVRFVFSVNDASINVDELSAKITYVNYKGETVTATVEEVEVYNAERGYYCFSFDGLLAAELRTVLNAVIYNGEERISSTSIYSVDTYGNGKTGDMLALCKALAAYSDTALAFFNN